MVVCIVQKNNDFLIKTIKLFWKDFCIIANKYKSEMGNYWIEEIYKNNKLIKRNYEKIDKEKTSSELLKEIINLIK